MTSPQCFCFSDTAPTEIYTLSLHDALPISMRRGEGRAARRSAERAQQRGSAGGGEHDDEERSEEHTSELQSHSDLVCRLLLEKKKTDKTRFTTHRPTASYSTDFAYPRMQIL